MVTTYNQKDLISFGNYMVSKERKEAFEATQSEISGSLEDRLGSVHAGDMEKWMNSKSNEGQINRKPKVGDIVNYIPSSDQDYDKHARNNHAEVIPAIVTAVWSEECINITAFPDAPYEAQKEGASFCPAAISLTSVAKLPEGTHNPQTGMWYFK